MALKYPEDNKYSVPTPAPTVSPAPVVETPIVSASPGSVFVDESLPASTTNASVFPEGTTSQAQPAASVRKNGAASAEPKSPPKTAKEMTAAERYLARYQGVDKKDLIDILQDKLRQGKITDEERSILEELLRADSDMGNPSTKSAADASKKAEYENLYNKNGSTYEKLFAVLDKYFTENDANYKMLSAEDKKAYLDSKIAEFKKLSGASENVSPEQLEVIMKNMAQVYIDSAVTNRPLSELKTKDDLDNRLKEIESKNADKSSEAKDKNSAIKAEYEEIYSKSGTEYERTSRVIDKYLLENDSKYQSLRSENEKRQYRDSLIANMRVKLGYSKNITQAQRNIMQKEIAKLFMDAAVTGVPLSANTPAAEVKSRLKSANAKTSKNILGDLKFDESKTALQQLDDVILQIASKDPRYKNLTDDKAKQKYIEDVKAKISKQLFAINIDIAKLKPEDKEALSRIALSAIHKLQSDGVNNLDDLTKLASNSDFQNTFMAKVLTDNKDLINKIENPETRKQLEVTLAKADIYNEIKANNPKKSVLEKDILKYLKQMDKEGKLDSFALKKLYKVYANLEKLPGALDEESNMTSLASMCLLTGMQPDEYLTNVLCDKDGNLLKGEKLKEGISDLKRILGDSTDNAGIKVLRDFLLKHNVSKDKLDDLFYQTNIVNDRQFRHALANSDSTMAAYSANVIQKLGSDAEIASYNNINLYAASVLKPVEMQSYQTQLSDQAYNVFSNNLNTGVHQYYTQAEQDQFRNSMVTSEDVSSTRKTEFTKSYIVTGSPEQQLHDAKYFSTVKDPAVTEGLAAAVPHIKNTEVRNTVNSYVDNAIKNNGYSSNEIKSINTARDTGKTSYEKNTVSSDNKASNTTSIGNSQKLQSSSSNNTAATNSSGSSSSNPGSTSDVTQKVSVSVQTKSAVNELKTKLSDIYKQSAQASYEHSLAEREKTLNSLQAIIDKIQNDQEVRAQKQAENAAKEAKTDEEIAKAKEEADVRTDKVQQDALVEIADECVDDVQKKYGISQETLNELKSAQRQGDLSTIYSKLAKISPEAQKHFIQRLSRKDTATIIGFIRSRSSDKSLIRELCRLNPSLIRILEPDLLESCGIAKADIIKYASPSHLAMLMYDLAKTGKIDQLKQFIEALGDDAPDFALNSRPVPGDDRFYAMHNTQQVPISSLSPTVVGHSKFSKGQTRQTIRPQDYPDYREFLA